MDFFDTSVVAKFTTIRILAVTILVVTDAIHNWFLHQIIDVNMCLGPSLKGFLVQCLSKYAISTYLYNGRNKYKMKQFCFCIIVIDPSYGGVYKPDYED